MSEMLEKEIEQEFFTPKDRTTRGRRRKRDYAKAARLRNIHAKVIEHGSGEVDGPELGRLKKGKIHCSCPLCSAKVNDAMHKKGASKNWPMPDRKKLDSMKEQAREYSEGGEVNG